MEPSPETAGRETPPRSEALLDLAARTLAAPAFRGATLGGVRLRPSRAGLKLAPEPGDLIVKKYRSSGFWGTNLDLLLRSNGIKSIVTTGATWSGRSRGGAERAAQKTRRTNTSRTPAGSPPGTRFVASETKVL